MKKFIYLATIILSTNTTSWSMHRQLPLAQKMSSQKRTVYRLACLQLQQPLSSEQKTSTPFVLGAPNNHRPQHLLFALPKQHSLYKNVLKSRNIMRIE